MRSVAARGPALRAGRGHAAGGLWRAVRSGPALALLLVALCAGSLALHWPGAMNNDSVAQLRQAASGQYEDWHPPVMAWLWGLLLRAGGEGPAPMLLAQLLCFWGGLALLAGGLHRAGRPGLALLLALAGVFPPFLVLGGTITKDAGMVAAWVGAVGVIGWFRLAGARVPWWAALLAALLLAYGTLVRTNAIFALGPLLVWALWALSPFWPRGAGSWWQLALAAVVVAVLALPATRTANTLAFAPKATNPEHSLMLFDLLGIAAHTGDAALLRPYATLDAQQLRACYTPYWWDSLSPWGRCGALVSRPAGAMGTQPEGLLRHWAGSIAAHPLAYARHRLKHFNSSILLAVPAKHVRLTPEYAPPDALGRPMARVSERELRTDILRKNFLTWPATWLAWGVALLVLLHRHGGAQAGLARALAVSALAYSGAHLLVGVATDMRYHYWSLLALLLATVLAGPLLAQAWRERSRPLVAGLGAVLLVVLAGTLTRLLDVRAFV